MSGAIPAGTPGAGQHDCALWAWLTRHSLTTFLLPALLATCSISLGAPALADTALFSNPAQVDCRAFQTQDGNAREQNDPQPVAGWAELKVGEWLIVANVCPQARYFPSGLILTPGATYEISATGRWKDGFLPATGPEGWPGLLLEGANRIPWRRMVSLAASVGRSERRLVSIGRLARLSTPPQLGSPEDRRLYLFANDWPWRPFYANNRDLDAANGGPMRVSIRRLS